MSKKCWNIGDNAGRLFLMVIFARRTRISLLEVPNPSFFDVLDHFYVGSRPNPISTSDFRLFENRNFGKSGEKSWKSMSWDVNSMIFELLGDVALVTDSSFTFLTSLHNFLSTKTRRAKCPILHLDTIFTQIAEIAITRTAYSSKWWTITCKKRFWQSY